MSQLKEKMQEYLACHPIDLGSWGSMQCVEFLYQAYKDCREHNSETINALYSKLGVFLETMPREQSNNLFRIIVDLADESEKEGFLAGLRFGVRFTQETDTID